MTRRNVRKQGWVFPLFSPDSDDRLSLNFHRFVILYISCDTRSVGLGQYCLPKGSNSFNMMPACTFPSAFPWNLLQWVWTHRGTPWTFPFVVTNILCKSWRNATARNSHTLLVNNIELALHGIEIWLHGIEIWMQTTFYESFYSRLSRTQTTRLPFY